MRSLKAAVGLSAALGAALLGRVWVGHEDGVGGRDARGFADDGHGAHTPSTSSTGTTPPSTTPTSTDGGTPGPAGTRTAPEPAFTQGAGAAEGLSAATAVVRANGFTPTDTSVYHSEPDPAGARRHPHRLG